MKCCWFGLWVNFFFKICYLFLPYYLLRSPLVWPVYIKEIHPNFWRVSTVHQLHFLASCWHMLNWKLSPSQLLVLTDQCECKWRKWVSRDLYFYQRKKMYKINWIRCPTYPVSDAVPGFTKIKLSSLAKEDSDSSFHSASSLFFHPKLILGPAMFSSLYSYVWHFSSLSLQHWLSTHQFPCPMTSLPSYSWFSRLHKPDDLSCSFVFPSLHSRPYLQVFFATEQQQNRRLDPFSKEFSCFANNLLEAHWIYFVSSESFYMSQEE